MQQNQAIIVCSVYQSETSESIVRLIRDLCPSQEIIFQPLQKTTQFDGKKVVFCHSSCSGRLALTDVNDSIYDSAVKDASRTVGKENVAFVVTDVEATDVYLRRKMITQTQHTLVSETNLLLLLGKVDDIDGEVLGQFKEFLTIHSPQRRPFPPQDGPNQPPYYDLLKLLPQFAFMVIIIACFVSVNSRLDLFQSHINMLRQESFDRIHHLEQTLEVEFQSKLETKMEDLRKSLTEKMGYHTSQLQIDLRHRIEDVQTKVSNKLQTELQNHSNVQRMQADHINQTLIFLQQTVNMTLKQSNDKTTLETLLRDNINDFKKEFQNELDSKMEDIQSSLSRDMEKHRSMLTDLASQITNLEFGIQTAIKEGHRQEQDSQYSELLNITKDFQNNLHSRIEEKSSQLQTDLRHQIVSVQTVVLNKLRTELKSHSSAQRNDSTMRADDIDQKLVLLQRSVNKTLELSVDKTTLENVLQNKLNDHEVPFQNELKTNMKEMQILLTENMENHKSNLTALASQITNIQTAIMEGHRQDQDSQYSELINVTKDIRNNLQSRMDNSSQLQAELHSTVNDMQTRIEGRCSELQDLGKEVQSIHTRLQNLQDSVGRLKSELTEFITKRVTGQWNYIKNSFEDLKSSFQNSMENLKDQLKSIESKLKDD
ncbi:DNA repair protein RAD50-like [Anneissia japonica]|uniref:DNA repair protein RAD50-like n=1 Tax=Anneissia japonica TaxID=1529436 RepID=UPI0014257A6B|nr:DNA repair protein RAD50-like [Anneissia japonica]